MAVLRKVYLNHDPSDILHSTSAGIAFSPKTALHTDIRYM